MVLKARSPWLVARTAAASLLGWDAYQATQDMRSPTWAYQKLCADTRVICGCRDSVLMVMLLKVFRHELLFYAGMLQGQVNKDTMDKVCSVPDCKIEQEVAGGGA